MGLARGWMMPGLAGRDCEAAGRGQPVGEKELGCQAEMLGGKVKWFFPGLVIDRSGENGEARCGFQVLSWLMGAGRGGLQFLGDQRGRTTPSAHPSTPLDRAALLCWVSGSSPC